MRTLINNKNIRSAARPTYSGSRLENDNNNMKKEIVFPLVIGLILGALVVIFWQFTVRLNNQNARLVQLEQYASQNAQAVNEIVTFINNATNPQGGAQTQTPPVTPAQ